MAVVYTVTGMCKISSQAYDSPTCPGTNPHPRVRQCASLAHGPLSVSIWKAFQRHGQRTRRLVVEPEYSRNHRPEFQAEFGVSEEEADRSRLALPSGPVSIPLPLKYPTHGTFPMYPLD
jgi:hypothetical protein